MDEGRVVRGIGRCVVHWGRNISSLKFAHNRLGSDGNNQKASGYKVSAHFCTYKYHWTLEVVGN